MIFDEVCQQLEEALRAAVALINSDPETTKELHNKEQQLIQIEKSVCQFHNKTVPIPDELRNLKLKLVIDIDQLKQQVVFKNKVAQLLQSTLPVVQDFPIRNQVSAKKKRRKTQGRVTLKEMFDTQTLKADIEIHALLRGNKVIAKITAEGQIKIHSTGQCFDSPSSAAVAVAGHSVNGWAFWRIEEGNKNRDLDYYRTQHKKQLNRGSKDESFSRR